MSNLVRLVVFVPTTHADQVRQAMGEAGAGQIGNYTFCSFSVTGTGRFKPNTKATPAIGEVDTINEVAEERIEVACSREQVTTIVAAIRRVHPYEEVVIDIYELSP
ncbi:MAG: hypothetical protein HYV33_03125 [Candidatus Kerfeldbacteria bacterium]|nr:hypothetical protein [Candidatus Kerfeldbacteria bacterium]